MHSIRLFALLALSLYACKSEQRSTAPFEPRPISVQADSMVSVSSSDLDNIQDTAYRSRLKYLVEEAELRDSFYLDTVDTKGRRMLIRSGQNLLYPAPRNEAPQRQMMLLYAQSDDTTFFQVQFFTWEAQRRRFSPFASTTGIFFNNKDKVEWRDFNNDDYMDIVLGSERKDAAINVLLGSADRAPQYMIDLLYYGYDAQYDSTIQTYTGRRKIACPDKKGKERYIDCREQFRIEDPDNMHYKVVIVGEGCTCP